MESKRTPPSSRAIISQLRDVNEPFANPVWHIRNSIAYGDFSNAENIARRISLRPLTLKFIAIEAMEFNKGTCNDHAANEEAICAQYSITEGDKVLYHIPSPTGIWKADTIQGLEYEFRNAIWKKDIILKAGKLLFYTGILAGETMASLGIKWFAEAEIDVNAVKFYAMEFICTAVTLGAFSMAREGLSKMLRSTKMAMARFNELQDKLENNS
jgi:hypothetical protein